MSVVVTNRTGSPVRVDLRVPTPADGAGLWRLVERCEALDTNSPYAYLLVCSHFARSSAVADVADLGDGSDGAGRAEAPDRAGTAEGRRLGGFLSAYRLPGSPETLFVWQIAVAPEFRGLGLGRALLDAVLDRSPDPDPPITHVEATVTPDNAPSDGLFRSLATARRATVRVDKAFASDLFPHPGHRPELRYRIGPIRSPCSPCSP